MFGIGLRSYSLGVRSLKNVSRLSLDSTKAVGSLTSSRCYSNTKEGDDFFSIFDTDSELNQTRNENEINSDSEGSLLAQYEGSSKALKDLADEIEAEPDPEVPIIQTFQTPEEVEKRKLELYERAIEIQQEGQKFLREEKFDLAIESFFSSLSGFSDFIDYKYASNEENSEVDVQKQTIEMKLDPLVGLAFAQQCIGRIEESKQTYTQIFDLIKDLDEYNDTYIRCLINYSELLGLYGEPSLAIEQINNNVLKKLDKNSELYASSICNLSVYYAISKNFEKALEFSKLGYELFSKCLGINNPYTERALLSYVRLLNDQGSKEQATQLYDDWNSKKTVSEFSSNSDIFDREVSDDLKASLNHFSHKNTFDPDGFIVPANVLENQRDLFAKECNREGFGNSELIDQIQPEIDNLKEVIGRSKGVYAAIQAKEREKPDDIEHIGFVPGSFSQPQFHKSRETLPKE